MEERNREGMLLATVGVGAFGAALLVARALTRRAHEYELEGKVVLITGGSRGLGLVMARELALEGARLVICARDPEELERARHDLEGRGAEVLSVPCDVTDRSQVQYLVATARDRFEQIDVLINNAGLIQVGPMEVQTLEDYEEAMRIHYWAPLYTILAVLPEMRERGEGRIVNISSIGGKVAFPHLLPYCASKFALVGLSEGLRAELAKDGIVVTTVCPGLMRTGSPRKAYFKGQHRAEYAWFTIGDSLPVSSISAEKAARQIIRACKNGDAEVVLSLPAQAMVLFHGIFPGLTADILGAVNRLLPEPGGIGTERVPGAASESWLAPSILTALTQRAARDNNEI
jgi:short-subunit dehydrogenase